MESWETFTERYVGIYQPLATQFLERIANTNVSGITEPFLPAAGRNYPTAPCKIVFAGMETRGYGDMINFVEHAKQSTAESLLRSQGEVDDFDFVEWTNNFGTSFWDFALKFLAGFHGVENWKDLKRRQRPDILSSFGWANLNALERYEVTAQKRGTKWDDWNAVKQASRIFDSGEHIIRAFAPALIVVVNWTEDESWVTTHRAVAERTEVFDHLLYLRLQPCGTHVVWTAHPTWLKFHDFDGYVARCVQLAKEKLGRNK